MKILSDNEESASMQMHLKKFICPRGNISHKSKFVGEKTLQAPKILRQSSLFDFGHRASAEKVHQHANLMIARTGSESQGGKTGGKKEGENTKADTHSPAEFRQRKKQNQVSAGNRAKDAVLGANSASSTDLQLLNLEENPQSRSGNSEWKKRRNGKKGGVVQRRHTRINLHHPLFGSRLTRLRLGWIGHQRVSASF